MADGVVASRDPALRKAPRMMRVLIVDDEAPARDKLRRWLGEHADIDVVGEAADGLAAAAAIENLQARRRVPRHPDAGLSAASKWRRSSSSDTAPLLVFVTAYDEHAIKRLRAERHRLSAEALRQGPAAEDAAAPARAARRRARRRTAVQTARAQTALQRTTAGAAGRSSCSSSRPAPSTGSRPTTTTCTCTPRGALPAAPHA